MMDNSVNAVTASLMRGTSATSVEDLRRLGNVDERAGLQAATQQFEGLFIQMMLKTMRSTVGENAMFSSYARNTFQEMQDTETAKQIAASGGLGLTQQIIDSVMQQANLQPKMEAAPANVAAQNIQTFLQTRGVAE